MGVGRLHPGIPDRGEWGETLVLLVRPCIDATLKARWDRLVYGEGLGVGALPTTSTVETVAA